MMTMELFFERARVVAAKRGEKENKETVHFVVFATSPLRRQTVSIWFQKFGRGPPLKKQFQNVLLILTLLLLCSQLQIWVFN